MAKRLATAGLLSLTLVTGLNAGRNRSELKAPVCRFIEFYVAAEKSDMSEWERIVYGLAVATKKPAPPCTHAASARRDPT